MRPVLVALPLLIAAAGCSASPGLQQPKAADFNASCHAMAEPVLALGRTLHGLGSKAPSEKQRAALKSEQDALRALKPTSEVAQNLVTTVGIVRIRTDTNSYSQDVATSAFDAYEAVVGACT